LNKKPNINPSFDLTPMIPARLFDNFYYVGTRSVGSFIISTRDGLIMIDTGWGGPDCTQLVNNIKKLNIDPVNIKLILISHEHLDHYGGVPYLKKNVCPDAKVAMSAIGWNYLKTRPAEPLGGPYSNPRPQSIDIFLTDGQKITLGDAVVQIIATPGHTWGCVSFITPVTDNGIPHTVGIMGGATLSSNWDNAYHYKASIDYFQIFTRKAKCDVGLAVHFGSYESKLMSLLVRKHGEANPLVMGTEKFESMYLQQYRDRFQSTVDQMPPEKLPPIPPWIK
jgi:metallo-beta-lactamase class B